MLRGVDRAEVEGFLASVADRIEELAAEQERLVAQLGDTSGRDIESEFETIGREVTAILQSTREAADAMRERASVDAARWRSEAMAEAEENRRNAAADAEAMRRDAWATGTEILNQVAEEATQMREQAERDVLTVMGEAEREAHRLTSGARREAEDLLRNTTMDAEKATSEAAKRRDDIIEAANRAAAAAQERTRALEQRRDELLEELENVRSTLTRLEGSLEERRETLDLSKSTPETTSVRVVPTRPPVVEEDGEFKVWEPGETVRVIPTERARPEPAPPVGEPEPEPEPEPVAEDPIAEPEPEPEPESREAAQPSEAAVDEQETETEDDVSALFASLRGGGEADDGQDESKPVKPPKQPEAPPVAESVSSPDWIDVRDERLLPITNRALRGTKKSLAELQNIALDNLRTDESWRPDEARIAEVLQAEIIGVWAESYAAGHAVAEEMVGSKLKRPQTPSSQASNDFAKALATAVGSALDQVGDGQRERQSAASRVYRVWRTDEAERRIRDLAIHAYELAIEQSADVGEPVS